MPLVKMRARLDSGDREDILVNTDAIQVVSPAGDRAILVILGDGNSAHCEGTVDEFLAVVDRAEGK